MDDGQKPDVGKQKTEKLIPVRQGGLHRRLYLVELLLASLKIRGDARPFLNSANAGPSQLAGELCSPYVFSTSWQNEQPRRPWAST